MSQITTTTTTRSTTTMISGGAASNSNINSNSHNETDVDESELATISNSTNNSTTRMNGTPSTSACTSASSSSSTPTSTWTSSKLATLGATTTSTPSSNINPSNNNINNNNNNNNKNYNSTKAQYLSLLKQMYQPGDQVKIIVEHKNNKRTRKKQQQINEEHQSLFYKLQQGHGGWNEKMNDVLERVGTVHRITDKGDIRVQYEPISVDDQNRWTIYPFALNKVNPKFHITNLVRITFDEQVFRALHNRQSFMSSDNNNNNNNNNNDSNNNNNAEEIEWTLQNSRRLLGKICRIVAIFFNGNIRVACTSSAAASSSSSQDTTTTDRNFDNFTLNQKVCYPIHYSSSSSSSHFSHDNSYNPHHQNHHQYQQQHQNQHQQQHQHQHHQHQHRADPMTTMNTLNIELRTLLQLSEKSINAQQQNNKIDCLLPKEHFVDQLIHLAANGDLKEFKNILLNGSGNDNNNNKLRVASLLKSSSSVDCGRTALHAAAYQGHLHIIAFLLEMTKKEKNANTSNASEQEADAEDSSSSWLIEQTDHDGDSALHFACFGDQPSSIKMLLAAANEADVVNKLNRNRCSPLHVAVNKQHPECVEALLENSASCKLSIKDSFGDTPLHDIVGKKKNNSNSNSAKILDLLLTRASRADLFVCNKRGFNVFHQACLKGNANAVRKLLEKTSNNETVTEIDNENETTNDLIDSKKSDGLAGLHLAALNGCAEVIECLFEYNANLEIVTNRRQTPLLMAASQKNIKIVELLVQKKANIHATDEDGDSCMHLMLNEKAGGQTSGPNKPASSSLTATAANETQNMAYIKSTKTLSAVLAQVPRELIVNARLVAALYLIQQDADLNAKNRAQFTCLEYLNDLDARAFLQKQFYLNQQKKIEELKSTVDDQLLPKKKCVLCDEELCSVLFKPCQHMVVCLNCSIRLKRCLECNELIAEKQMLNGTPITHLNKIEFSDLIVKVKDLEEAQMCSICMENKKETVFQCGHIVCNQCAQSLKTCHICREKITKRIKIFEN